MKQLKETFIAYKDNEMTQVWTTKSGKPMRPKSYILGECPSDLAKVVNAFKKKHFDARMKKGCGMMDAIDVVKVNDEKYYIDIKTLLNFEANYRYTYELVG